MYIIYNYKHRVLTFCNIQICLQLRSLHFYGLRINSRYLIIIEISTQNKEIVYYLFQSIKSASCIVTYIICNIFVGGKSPKSGTLAKPLFIIRLKDNQESSQFKATNLHCLTYINFMVSEIPSKTFFDRNVNFGACEIYLNNKIVEMHVLTELFSICLYIHAAKNRKV